jgi:ankyrin repeat protein
VISKLTKHLNEGGSREEIDALEDAVVESIDEAVAEDSFYSLPTNEILKILQKSSIESVELLSSIVSQMSENKGEESPLLLNVIDPKDATFDDFISIISKFTKCPLCRRIGKLHNINRRLPDRDYEHEIEELKKSKKAHFARMTEKPSDFESDIHRAAEQGKLSSVQYLVKKCNADVEAKNEDGYTPIIISTEKGHLKVVKYLHEKCNANVEATDNDGKTPLIIATEKGHLEIVKYLHEECHMNVEAKDNDGLTPIIYATANGHLEVVKYLVEKCHANVEVKGNSERTPIIYASREGHLEVVKYLHEECHANAEEEDDDGMTPIMFASENGHLEVVKYLVEECHATITDDAISWASNDEITKYLQSKR